MESIVVDHDVHVHTTLSECCRDPEATASNILNRARECGLRTIGFADHLWDRSCPGASDWYKPQDIEHVMSIREGVSEDDMDGITVLWGCESEYGGVGKVGIGVDAAARFDFVLLPMSHFHMRGYVVPEDLADPGEVANLMVRRFDEVIALGIANGIAHPFLPCGHLENADRILSLIPDESFQRSFAAAAQSDVSIEITTGFFPGCRGGETESFHDTTFLRVLRLARAAGCSFHFASDAHTLEGVGDVFKLEPYVQECGVTREHVAGWVRG